MSTTSSTTLELIRYLNAAPTPYHAVESAMALLRASGFTPLALHADWRTLEPGRYVVSVGGSALLAFVLPSSRNLQGARIVGAHTDSPNLRLKPNAEYTREGYRQIGVEVYGGALLNSWLDRDLGIAGRLTVRGSKAPFSRLFRLDRPMARVAQLAIHLDREVNEKGLVLNRQEHLPPLFGLTQSVSQDSLVATFARSAAVDPSDVLGVDAMLFDLTAATLGGINNEFVFSARLDNLAMCHAAITALQDAANTIDGSDVVPVAVLFDHEEIGSQSATGAQSPMLGAVLERIALARMPDRGRDGYHAFLAGSLCISADMAHAVHPNYPDRHEARHKVHLNAGPVIKVNAQQRYATCGRTAALFRSLCEHANVPFQTYAHRTDLACGTTIGPITSSQLGIATVDVGNPMLSMHSAREMTGAEDPVRMVSALTRFFHHNAPLE